jgi:peptide/nickel transport system substrate-binding protein
VQDADPQSPDEGLSRRELLVKAGAIGVGTVVSGSLAGEARSAVRRRYATPIRRGGKITWALEIDPQHVAPFGALVTSNHWGKQYAYDSLLEWDRNLNIKPALAASYKVVGPREVLFNLRRGVRFHNGKELDAGDVKYSVELMLNPPLPGSVAAVGQVPAIEGVDVVSKYVARLRLKAPDARIFNFFAWARYSPIVPAGLYDQINVARGAIGTGPYRMLEFIPNDRVEYVANPRFWKQGQPYMDAITLKTLVDEQARVAALRTGAIDGGTFSPDNARAMAGDSSLKVLRNLTAAFRELLMEIDAKNPKPWRDVRVRQAVNFAINRQAIIDTVFGGAGDFSGHVPPGYGPWPLRRAELRQKYLKFDLPAARKLMAAAGQSRGFSVELMTFSTPLDFPQVASIIQLNLKAINIDVKIVTMESGTLNARAGVGTFEWALTSRGMRGDVDGFLAEFNPSAPINQIWSSGWKNVHVWRDIGNGRITLEEKKRLPLYKDAQKRLLTDLPHVPLVAVTKWQVVRRRVQNMYVGFDDFNTGLRETWLSE